jgi:phage terminase small subunit
VIEGKTRAQAARDAGYSESTALVAADRIESKPAVQSVFTELLERAGLTDEKLAKRLNEGVDAKETRFFQKDGEVVSTRTVIDYGTRLNYTQTVLKLKGHLVDRIEKNTLSIAVILAASFDTE